MHVSNVVFCEFCEALCACAYAGAVAVAGAGAVHLNVNAGDPTGIVSVDKVRFLLPVMELV